MASKDTIVFEGTVLAVEDMPTGGIVSEHIPVWKRAKVHVRKEIQGSAPVSDARALKVVDVYFASSTDVMWYKAPKLQVGQQGTFTLHHFDTKDPPVFRSTLSEDDLFVIYKSDVTPV